MSTLLTRLGAATAAHPWRTIAAWIVVLAATVGLASAVGGQLKDDYTVAGSPSQAGSDFLTSNFPQLAGTDARVVVHSTTSGGLTATSPALAGLHDRLAAMPHASSIDPPRISADGDTALVGVHYDVPVTELSGTSAVDALRAAGGPLQQAGFTVAYGGQVPENISAVGGSSELVGVIAALLILLAAFGAVLAAGMPLVVAFVGLGVGSSLVTLMAAFSNVSSLAPTVATMVGIGVGIDYALLLVTRFAENLRVGMPVREAAARSNGSAGMSVVFAGVTVLVSLLGLKLAGLPTYSSFGYSTALVVSCVMLAAITLVPALCSLAGYRVLRRRHRAEARTAGDRPGRHEASHTFLPDTLTARWARLVGRRPWAFAIGAATLLLILAVPVLQLRTWPQDASSQPASNTTRQAYDLVADEFGPGANGPFLVVVDLPGSAVPASEVSRRVAALPGVSHVTAPIVNAAGNAAVIVAEPTTGPQDEATTVLLQRIRAEVGEGNGTVMVTGLTPAFADITERLSQRLWLVIGFVVLLSLVLLTVVFRSVVVPVKAALLNLLSVGAAYGVMVMLFQWGWGVGALGLPHAVAISSWVPILMFAILFGLSMDYQVFLLSRVREDWLATGDARASVVHGLSSTGRVITSAAAIMVAVFLGFALDADPVVKMMGVGMAVAVTLDATVVRMVLVPATMSLLGQANWWLPAWLDRILPHIDVEGDGLAAPDAADIGGHEAEPQTGPDAEPDQVAVPVG